MQQTNKMLQKHISTQQPLVDLTTRPLLAFAYPHRVFPFVGFAAPLGLRSEGFF